MNPTIAVSTTKPELESHAINLAQQLNLAFTHDTANYDHILLLTPKHLSLVKVGEKSLPLVVDFLSGKLTYRRQHASLRNESLARALGLNHRTSPKIVDATAGLARDSFILASLGFDVILLERSPIIHALVADGIKRGLENPHVEPIMKRLHLIQTEAISWLKNSEEKPDIIYLDPMFPERQKTALVKKEMRIFHDLVGEDLDSEELLRTALACATKRVMVKRPRLADPINNPVAPSFSMKGSSSRFDVYLIQDTHGNSTSLT